MIFVFISLLFYHNLGLSSIVLVTFFALLFYFFVAVNLSLMKKIAILIVALFLFASCGPGAEGPESANSSDGKIKVIATIPPLADMIRSIGGDQVEVVQIMPAGASPHIFEVSPSLVENFEGATVAFSIGHGLDNWADDLLGSVDGLETLVVDDSVKTKIFDGDPHYWLSPRNANIMARNVSNRLVELDPENIRIYMEGLLNYQDAINAAEDAIKLELSDLQNRKILVFHDSWNYFADAFDLEVVDSFVAVPGQEPTAKELEALYGIVEAEGINDVYSEPQLSPETMRPFVEDLGLELHVMDPIGGEAGRESIAEILKYNAFLIYEAQK
jgi:zinc transport system substrate-binding protein